MDSNMDHNLDDSLNLEGTIGVDFEQPGDTVVNQGEISLDVGTSHEESIAMEFEHIEEQPMLMDTGSEEIIDFMGEQFTLQEYSVHDDQMTSATTTVEANQQLTSEGMFDLQFETQPISVPASGIITQEVQMPSKYITVKAGLPTMRAIAPKKETVVVSKSTAPRQVAIAPKLPKLAPANVQKISTIGKPFTIASNPVKPVKLVANRHINLVQKMNTGQETEGNAVLAQIGKQLVVMPGNSGPKIKLVPASGMRLLGAPDGDQAQLIGPLSGTKPKLTKVIVQGVSGSDTSNQPAVITKMMSGSGNAGTPTTRYVTMHQKTIPISIGNNKVVMASPTKSGVRYAKKQVITIKSPTAKLVPSSSNQGPTKKVVITANPTQNVILKTTAPPKTGHVTKIGPKTQLHQINVPGKGIQYIKLVTNPSSSVKTEPKPQAVTTPKTFVLTDSKGNLIRMTAEKMSTQPPPLVVTGTLTNSGKVVSSKPQQKLVRIAPITSKSGQAAMQNRGGQSLLAPLSPAGAAPSLPDVATLLDNVSQVNTYEDADEQRREHTEIDSKAALQALIADAVGSDADSQDAPDDGSATERTQQDDSNTRQSSEGEDSNSMERPESQNAEHPLIVIPSYMKQDNDQSDEHNFDGARRLSTMINVEVDPYDPYQPNSSQLMGENDLPSELDMRPRKACNCTKSQCLKLYCDCFANGEFCNGCNCTNCHNNLENEELRQKAIRGCLDRNPNAFRPKIGKSKTGGPEIIRRHNKGCNCKRSGCLKNYCECYEAKIACTGICRCVGCRNVEESLQRRRPPHPDLRPAPARSDATAKQPCNFMTMDVIEAVCQCMLASTVQTADASGAAPPDPVHTVIEEFACCLQDIIRASHQAAPLALLDEAQA